MLPTIVVPDPRLPLVVVTVSFRGGGTTQEPAEVPGIARMLARAMLRGTAGERAGEIQRRLDLLGAAVSFGAERECFTGHLLVLKQNLAPAVALFGDMLRRPSFEAEEMTALGRRMTHERLSLLDDDDYLASRAFTRGIFGAHPYARSVSDHAYEALGPDALASFHRERCVAARAAVAVSGAIATSGGEAVAQNLCALLPAGIPWEAEHPDPEAIRGRHLALVDKPDRTQVTFRVGHLGARYEDPDRAALLLGVAAFGSGTFQSRLMRELRAARGWTYGVHMGAITGTARGAFVIDCAVDETVAPDALRVQLDMLDALATHGVTAEEVEAARGYLTGHEVFERDTAPKRAAEALHEVIHGLPVGYLQRSVEAQAKATVDEVNTALKARCDPHNLVIAAVASEGVAGRLGGAVSGLASRTVRRFDE